MRLRWRVILPSIGLLLFAAETHHSVQTIAHSRGDRYFWWSLIRLDSDPLNKRVLPRLSCADGSVNCAQRVLQDMWIDPGWLAKILMWSAFPAFVVNAFIIVLLGRLGVSQVLSFMIF